MNAKKAVRPGWVILFDSLSHEEKRTVALSALERLIADQKVGCWLDDLVDKFGNEIPEDTWIKEHFYLKESLQENLKTQF